MNVNHFDPKKTALLFFDILNGYVPAPEPAKPRVLNPWIQTCRARQNRLAPDSRLLRQRQPSPGNATTALLLTATQLADAGPTAVSKTKFTSSPGQKSDGSPTSNSPDDYYIVSTGWSAFHQPIRLALPPAHRHLLFRVSTDVGVTSTLYSGRDLDYNMIVASDACGTSHDQRAHDMLMELVFPRMSRVRTTDQVIEMIQKAKS